MAIIKINNNAIDLNAAEIPNLDAAKITTGQFADAKIADVASSKITGTITPSDNTVSLAKLTATGTQDATTFLRGDNTFAEAGGGLVLQVVSTTKTDTFSVTSGSYTDLTGLSVSITPSSSSNKILVLVNLNAVGQDNQTFWKVVRASTDISVGATAGSRTVTSGGNMYNESDGANLKNNSLNFLDSPSTTSATTYKIQIYSRSGPTLVNRSSADTDNADYGRSASTITLIEIAG